MTSDGEDASPNKICDSSRAPWLLHYIGLDDVLLVSLNPYHCQGPVITNNIILFELVEISNSELNLEFAWTWGKNQCWTSWSVYTGAKSNFPA